jgi:hypothetical protein
MTTAERTTFTDIYNYVLNKLGITAANMGDYTVGRVCDAINNSQHRLALMLMREGDQFLGSESTISIVADQELYSIGPGGDFNLTNYLEVKQIVVIDSTTLEEKMLQKIPVSDRYKFQISTNRAGASEALGINFYYFTTKAVTNSDVLLPAIGLVPYPDSAFTNGLKMFYHFKPRPIAYNDSGPSNGGQQPDIPEKFIPVLQTMTERLLLEHERSQEKIDMTTPRYAEEKMESRDAADEQAEDTPTFMEYYDDPLVDY